MSETFRPVYIGASMERAAEAEALAIELRELGIVVTSSWHMLLSRLRPDADTAIDPEFARWCAELDLADLDEARMFVTFTDGKHGRGGRQVELGYALARSYVVVILGPCEHVFHHHPSVLAYGGPESFLADVRTRRADAANAATRAERRTKGLR